MAHRLLVLLVLLNLPISVFADSGKLRVGVLAPLSGLAADYGIAVRNAIELQSETMSDSPSGVEFIFEDTQYNAKSAVDAFNKLRTTGDIDLLYVWGVIFCEAVAPLAEKFKVPMVAQCIQQSVTKDKSYVVRFANPSHDYTGTLWKLIRSERWKNIGVVLTDNAYLELMYDSLRAETPDGVRIELLDRYLTGQTDFRTTISKLRSGKYDTVAVFLISGQIGPFYKQLAEQRITLPTFGTNVFESLSEITSAAGAMEGAYLANNAVNEDFQNSYMKRYGNLSQITFASYAYDFSALVRSFAPVYSGNKDSLLAELIKAPLPKSTASGAIRIVKDPGGGTSFAFPTVVKVIRHGKPVPVDPQPMENSLPD